MIILNLNSFTLFLISITIWFCFPITLQRIYKYVLKPKFRAENCINCFVQIITTNGSCILN